MSELSTSFAEPAYIARLALNCAPFSKSVNDKLYYSGGQLEHRLNLLLHLMRASNKIGVLIADHGLGKSTLLTQLQSRIGDDLRVCMIEATQLLTSDTILFNCLQQLGVEQTDLEPVSNHSENFRNRLRQLRKLNIRPVLLIDDAQNLSDSVFTELSNWLAWKDNDQFLLQAIVTSTQSLHFNESVQARVEQTDIPPLTQAEMATYLSERMIKAGYSGDRVFTDKELKRFFSRSRGNPALINQLAHQRLLGLKPSLSDITSLKLTSIFSLRTVGIAIVIAFFSALLFYQDNLNSFFTVDTAESINDEIMVLQPEEQIATIDIAPDEIVSHQQAVRNELVELVEQIPMQTADDESDNNVENKPSAVMAESASEIKPEVAIIEQESASTLPELYREPWVQQQQGSDYTFQLMGSWQQQEVYDFVDKYALSGDVAMLESLRNGRSWYALVYGVFESKDAALAASKQWPAPLNTLPSWLRRFDSVQKQIKGSVQSP